MAFAELFKLDEEASRQNAETNAEALYDLVDRMPSFWRRSEAEATTSTTLFVLYLPSLLIRH